MTPFPWVSGWCWMRSYDMSDKSVGVFTISCGVYINNNEKWERSLDSMRIIKPLRGRYVGGDKLGPKFKITMFCSPLYLLAPNQLLTHC